MPHSNLSKKEKDALKTLSEKEDIIINKADKGASVITIEVDDYVKEANRQLGNTEF